MRPRRKRRLSFILLLMGAVALAAGFILYALRQNIDLYYTPTDLFTERVPVTHSIRLGGFVLRQSVHRETNGWVLFTVTDFHHWVRVRYRGILPALFHEGRGVVVEGRLLGEHVLLAERVLAKHDANYHPPNVSARLRVRSPH